ncbi:MAG: hypothetical protein QOE06_788 [Thermoleophilaceae bacterium]|jgi:hypothetical protein|nr:hypothetical protein [Thermoleophilaceae bacterium]
MRRSRHRKHAQELRRAIDCLPRGTRVAMADSLEDQRIIVGAYTDGDGGICPMLAAHRNGGRTNLASFARAWDRYTGASTMREASDRELRTLRAMLEASLYYEDNASDLAKVASEHRALTQEREERDAREKPRRDTGERDRSGELGRRHGWAWLRVFRRLDEYEAAVAEAERQAAGDSAEAGRDARERELV